MAADEENIENPSLSTLVKQAAKGGNSKGMGVRLPVETPPISGIGSKLRASAKFSFHPPLNDTGALEALQAQLNEALKPSFVFQFEQAGSYGPHLYYKSVDQEKVKKLVSVLENCGLGVEGYRKGSTYLVRVFNIIDQPKFQQNQHTLAQFAKGCNVPEKVTICTL